MRFDTYFPCKILKSYVRAFVISEAEAEHTYKVLPGTGVVIGFQYRGKLSLVRESKEVPLEVSGLTGIHDQYRMFRNTPDTGSVLVYFQEGGAAAFFSEPIHLLFGESVSLDNFMLRSELLILEEKLCEASSDADKIRVVEQFLISRMKPLPPDKLVMEALAIIYRNNGNLRIKTLAEQLHTSQSPLEKRFRRIVGTTPKKFASILRLKYAIRQFNPDTPLTDLGYAAGFYDQAHFIKEFKTFTGSTPDNFFSGS